MHTIKHYDVIILGSGPAGYTAAIYTARANLKTAIITGPEQGGQLLKTANIDNWPGESQGISGPALMDNMLKQAQRFNVECISDEITQADLSQRPFKLNNKYSSNALIIATGSSAKYLGLPSEKQYMGRGVSGCAVCDGFFYKGKKVVVVGGGNTAAKEALYLSQIASEVIIVHRSEQLRIEPMVLDKLKNTANIKFELNYIIDEILGDSHGVNSVRIKHITSNQTKNILVSGVFIAIGYKPNTEFLGNQIELDQQHIKINGASTKTNIPGVFAAGDVTNQTYRQAIVAAGAGCMAAIDAKNFLQSR